MPTISRRQFTAAFGGISVAALAASATTLPAAAEQVARELVEKGKTTWNDRT